MKINTDRAVYCTSASSKAQKIKNSSKTVGWKVRRLREEWMRPPNEIECLYSWEAERIVRVEERGGNKRQYRVSGKEKGSYRLNDAWFPGYLGSLWGTYSCCLALTIWEASEGNKKKTLNKVDEHTGFSQWCRLSDSPKNHHLNTIP